MAVVEFLAAVQHHTRLPRLSRVDPLGPWSEAQAPLQDARNLSAVAHPRAAYCDPTDAGHDLALGQTVKSSRAF